MHSKLVNSHLRSSHTAFSGQVSSSVAFLHVNTLPLQRTFTCEQNFRCVQCPQMSHWPQFTKLIHVLKASTETMWSKMQSKIHLNPRIFSAKLVHVFSRRSNLHAFIYTACMHTCTCHHSVDLRKITLFLSISYFISYIHVNIIVHKLQ